MFWVGFVGEAYLLPLSWVELFPSFNGLNIKRGVGELQASGKAAEIGARPVIRAASALLRALKHAKAIKRNHVTISGTVVNVPTTSKTIFGGFYNHSGISKAFAFFRFMRFNFDAGV